MFSEISVHVQPLKSLWPWPLPWSWGHLDFWKPWDMPDECMCSPCDCDPFQAGLIRTPHKFKPHEFEQALEPLRMVHFYLCKCFLV